MKQLDSTIGLDPQDDQGLPDTTYSWAYKYPKSKEFDEYDLKEYASPQDAIRAAASVIGTFPAEGRLFVHAGPKGWAHLVTVARWRIYYVLDGIGERLIADFERQEPTSEFRRLKLLFAPLPR